MTVCSVAVFTSGAGSVAQSSELSSVVYSKVKPVTANCHEITALVPSIRMLKMGRGATVIVNDRVACWLGTPLSVTFNVTLWVVPACASPGVQVTKPPTPTNSPLGPETKSKVSVFAGESASVAVAFKDNKAVAQIVWSDGPVRMGAHLLR